jgi:hypothetical protein
MGILIILGVVFVLILAHQSDESGYREKCINDKARFEAMQKDKIHIKKIGKNKKIITLNENSNNSPKGE